MIGYTSLGTNNLSKSAQFYDTLLALLGAKRTFEFEDFIVWGRGLNEPMFSVHVPFNKLPASVGNGVMVALAADSSETVSRVYNKAIELGCANEGAPGYRAEGFYAAYFRDPDGNKLNVHFMG